MRVFDFFAGGGCFSIAAAEVAGVEAALGVDDWSVALSAYRRNHPGAAARGTTLPATWAALRVPAVAAADAVHAHFSPPCVAFSSSRRGRETEAEVELGVRLLTWSVEFAVRHGFRSYSVENVAVGAVQRLFQRLKAAHPGGFDYVELKAERLGAACERARLVGGSPGLVARLKALPELEPSQLRTMRQAFEAAGVAVPAEATHVRSCSGRYKPHGGGSAFALRSIGAERATTLVASRALVFATADGTTVRQLAPRESAALMGLPATMKLPDKVKDATAVLGNGIEAHTARAIVAAARPALAEDAEGAGDAEDAEDAAATATLPPARAAVDRAIAAATDAHVAWWRAWTRRRARVVDEAAEAGLARAKVLRILDALGEEAEADRG